MKEQQAATVKGTKKVDIESEIAAMKKRGDYRRERSRSRSLSPRSKALARAQQALPNKNEEENEPDKNAGHHLVASKRKDGQDEIDE